MNRITEIKVLEGFNVWMKFDDGLEKVINLKPFIGKGFTKELLDEKKFREAFIEEGGGIAWPNGYDFCPNYLREIEGQIVKNVA